MIFREAKEARDRREQDALRVLAEKKAMQEKLKANQRAEELRRKNAAQQYTSYSFDMLGSGDSTDDENRPSSKRPPAPLWSFSHNRQLRLQEQVKVNAKKVDTFFSVAPLEVNLRDIFPQIDEKYLRRNSSAVWNSPPRYSLLPKY